VPAASAISVLLSPGRAAALSASKPVSATVVSDVSGLVSIVPVLDYKNLGGELRVLVR
jgi:hypothetical protein